MKNKIAISLILSGLYISCTNNNNEDLYPHPTSVCYADTAQEISFSKDVIPVFSKNCAISGCHTGNHPEGGLNLDSSVAYQNLMAPGTGYIDTNDPSGSLLYSQMRSLSNPMPPTGRLDTCTTKLILKWIGQKAMNN